MAALGSDVGKRENDVRFRRGSRACNVVFAFEPAREVLRSLQERGRSSYISPAMLAMVHTGLGESEAALVAPEQERGLPFHLENRRIRRMTVAASWKVNPMLQSAS